MGFSLTYLLDGKWVIDNESTRRVRWFELLIYILVNELSTWCNNDIILPCVLRCQIFRRVPCKFTSEYQYRPSRKILRRFLSVSISNYLFIKYDQNVDTHIHGARYFFSHGLDNLCILRQSTFFQMGFLANGISPTLRCIHFIMWNMPYMSNTLTESTQRRVSSEKFWSDKHCNWYFHKCVQTVDDLHYHVRYEDSSNLSTRSDVTLDEDKSIRCTCHYFSFILRDPNTSFASVKQLYRRRLTRKELEKW